MCVIINTDTSKGNGEHWFPLFCDFRECPYSLEYFNSSGELPPPEIDIWMKRNTNILKKANKECVCIVPKKRIRHQKSDNECGVYSLYYIYNRLLGKHHSKFDDGTIPDSIMHAFRDEIFNTSGKTVKINRNIFGTKMK